MRKSMIEVTHRSFAHQPHPARVVFGRGAREQVAEEARRLGIARAIVIGEPARVDEARAKLGAGAVAAITDVVMHVPAARADAAASMAREVRADGVVAIGGGSAIGLAKAIALATGLPILAIPTTYAGSEMTSVWGRTEDGRKKTGRDDRVRPKTVLYDAELTLTLPPALAGTSALNAIAHAMEALYAPNLDPIGALLAEDCVRALATFAPRITGGAAKTDEAWDGCLYGAWLGGVSLDQATLGIHHKLCHTLGGTFGLPHAEVHSVILPYAAMYNLPAAPDALGQLARAIHDGDGAADAKATDAPAALYALARRLGAPASLAAIGLAESDLDRAAAIATESPYPNPRPVDRASVRALLQQAFVGAAPQPIAPSTAAPAQA